MAKLNRAKCIFADKRSRDRGERSIAHYCCRKFSWKESKRMTAAEFARGQRWIGRSAGDAK